jgi:CRP/FNR family cyclic AMP-dependent transcriptional regulator
VPDPTELLLRAVMTTSAAFETPGGRLALAAAVAAAMCLLAGAFVKTMIPLRWLQVGSNVGFMVYGAFFPSLPMLVLHALLLPINLFRVNDMVRLTRRVNTAADAKDTSDLWLQPYMRRRRLRAGTVIFRKGDPADKLYMLASGRIELVEIGSVLEPGRIFGEIAFFSPERTRTLTARCVEPCLLLSINETAVKQLYHQNPEFGFELIRLLAGRLTADIGRLQEDLAAARSTAERASAA